MRMVLVGSSGLYTRMGSPSTRVATGMGPVFVMRRGSVAALAAPSGAGPEVGGVTVVTTVGVTVAGGGVTEGGVAAATGIVGAAVGAVCGATGWVMWVLLARGGVAGAVGVVGAAGRAAGVDVGRAGAAGLACEAGRTGAVTAGV